MKAVLLVELSANPNYHFKEEITARLIRLSCFEQSTANFKLLRLPGKVRLEFQFADSDIAVEFQRFLDTVATRHNCKILSMASKI